MLSSIEAIDPVPGVYCIRNLVNGKLYIGSSYNVRKRLFHHRGRLKWGKHRNTHLQNAWNLYGEDNFQAILLESLPTDSRNEIQQAERYWLSFYRACQPDFGYNSVEETDSAGRRLSDETRRKLSEAHKGRPQSAEHRANRARAQIGRVQSQETKDKISVANQGNLNCLGRMQTESAKAKIGNANRNKPSAFKGRTHSEEAKSRIGNNSARNYLVTAPDGQQHLVHNLKAFCEQQQLKIDGMKKVVQGVRPAWKGWKCVRVDIDDNDGQI